MSKGKIVKLNKNPIGFGDIADELEESMFNSPLPKQHTHSYYEDESLGLYIGVWDTTTMIESAAPYACDEFMSIIEGTVEIQNNKTGMIETITADESFVIPQGYDCQWHQNGYLRKFHVIYQPKGELERPVQESVVYINEHSAIPWQATSDGHNKKVLYQNLSQTFTAGIWQSKGFNTDIITFPYNEFITIKKGNLICTDDTGIEHKVSPGDALFIPQGTHCSWLAKEEISIHFAQIRQL